jgi:hypothetical protein
MTVLVKGRGDLRRACGNPRRRTDDDHAEHPAGRVAVAPRGHHIRMARHPVAGSRVCAIASLSLSAASTRKWFRRNVNLLIDALGFFGG